jgi:hypothetical protein
MAKPRIFGTFIRDKNGRGVEIDELVNPHATRGSAEEEAGRLRKTLKGVHVEPLEVQDNVPDQRRRKHRSGGRP